VWNARAAADNAESAGALLSCTFQVAIAAGAVLGGLIIDALGARAVTLYAAVATLAGATLMFTRGRALEKR
jgi:predicted MFS family arabinose efflux permease